MDVLLLLTDETAASQHADADQRDDSNDRNSPVLLTAWLESKKAFHAFTATNKDAISTIVLLEVLAIAGTAGVSSHAKADTNAPYSPVVDGPEGGWTRDDGLRGDSMLPSSETMSRPLSTASGPRYEEIFVRLSLSSCESPFCNVVNVIRDKRTVMTKRMMGVGTA
eukprot:scaffold227633_cov31-Tisochrysis_lutea.AAC.4